MFFNNDLERQDVFLDEGIMFKVSPNPGQNLTHLRTTGPCTLIIPSQLVSTVKAEVLYINTRSVSTVKAEVLYTNT